MLRCGAAFAMSDCARGISREWNGLVGTVADVVRGRGAHFPLGLDQQDWELVLAVGEVESRAKINRTRSRRHVAETRQRSSAAAHQSSGA